MSQPLVSSDDPDLSSWVAGTQSYYLALAGEKVRQHCGWHISPPVSYTARVLPIRAGARVTLESTYVSEVTNVVIGNTTLVEGQDYVWDSPKGWLRIYPSSLSVPLSPPWSAWTAAIDYVSGYDETPELVKSVVFEVMATAQELPATNLDEVQSMQYHYKLRETAGGINLSPSQEERLSQYRLRKFGGWSFP